jgi:hypothetical protein
MFNKQWDTHTQDCDSVNVELSVNRPGKSLGGAATGEEIKLKEVKVGSIQVLASISKNYVVRRVFGLSTKNRQAPMQGVR